eukprot:scaffold795_cov187-Amphora_coffeaeformis.AAC.23
MSHSYNADDECYVEDDRSLSRIPPAPTGRHVSHVTRHNVESSLDQEQAYGKANKESHKYDSDEKSAFDSIDYDKNVETNSPSPSPRKKRRFQLARPTVPRVTRDTDASAAARQNVLPPHSLSVSCSIQVVHDVDSQGTSQSSTASAALAIRGPAAAEVFRTREVSFNTAARVSATTDTFQDSYDDSFLYDSDDYDDDESVVGDDAHTLPPSAVDDAVNDETLMKWRKTTSQHVPPEMNTSAQEVLRILNSSIL